MYHLTYRAVLKGVMMVLPTLIMVLLDLYRAVLMGIIMVLLTVIMVPT